MTILKKSLTVNLYKFVLVLPLILLACLIIDPVGASPGKGRIVITDPTPLTAFEGIYQSKDNEFSYFKVTAGTDNLVAKSMEGNQQFVLTRKSEFTFEMKDDDGDEMIPVVFTKSDAGEITQVLIGGKQLFIKVKNYVPVKEITLTPEQLKAFEGKYKFEEKNDAFLQITATADGLTLKQLWDNKEINFKAISDLSFLNKEMGFPLKFTKDQNGNVIKVLAFNRDMWDKVKE
jgi:hypothetical protein